MILKTIVEGYYEHITAKNFNEEIEFDYRHTRYLAHKALDETYEYMTDHCEYDSQKEEFEKMIEEAHKAISNKEVFDDYVVYGDYKIKIIIE